MLITFKCDACADITMFGDTAQRLLKMMGHSGTVPGAILAEDVAAALECLERAFAGQKLESSPPSPATADTEADERPVSIASRALPLIELLAVAAKKNCNVMWNEA